jgi:uncharacterized protein YjbI with pentapeptide repeats
LEEENRPARVEIPRKEATRCDPIICADPEQAHVSLRTGNALDKTILRSAVLSDANLNGAILYDAILSGAKLDKTVLSNARITEEQLKEAKSLQGATMPDGSIHP